MTFRISELVEKETEEYHKADPDPFDDRHPGRKKRRTDFLTASTDLNILHVFDIPLLATRES